MMLIMRVAAFGALSLVLLACAVSPTGRKQILLYSGDQMSQMGIAAYDSLKKERKLVTDEKTNTYVSCVTNQLLPYLPESMRGAGWEVSVFEDETPNAFALPGRKIGVHTGMIDLADNSAMLAAVIGHEIGHVWANHGNERMSNNTLAQVGMVAAAMAAGEQTAETQMTMAALGLAAQGVVLRYSRKHESEADEIGLVMMAKAGFDPAQAVALWQKMAAQGGSSMPEFFSTHPSEATRIKDLNRLLPQVMPLYQAAIAEDGVPKCERSN